MNERKDAQHMQRLRGVKGCGKEEGATERRIPRVWSQGEVGKGSKAQTEKGLECQAKG